MSQRAFDRNCTKCEFHDQLRRGKLAMEKRPCPGTGNKQLSPHLVRTSLHQDWVCSARLPLGAKAVRA